MSAITEAYPSTQYGPSPVGFNARYPVAAGAQCWQGGMAGLTASGTVQPAGNAGTTRVLGAFAFTCNNTFGADNAAWATVTQGVHEYDFVAGADAPSVANVGQPLYMVDDHTVGVGSSVARLYAGIFLGLSPSGRAFVSQRLVDVMAARPSERLTLQVSGISQSFADAVMAGGPALRAGSITEIAVVMGQKTLASGESYLLDIQQNGTSILSAPFTIDSTVPSKSVVSKFASLATLAVAQGDEFTASGIYAQGASPARPNFSINLVYA